MKGIRPERRTIFARRISPWCRAPSSPRKTRDTGIRRDRVSEPKGRRRCEGPVQRGARGRRHRRAADGCAAVCSPLPSVLSSRIVRQGLLADPADPVRYGRCAARRAICAGSRRQPRGARNAVREARGRARPSPRSRWSNSSTTPAPIARRATPPSTGCCRRTRACAWSIASCRSSGPTAWRRLGFRSKRRSRAVRPVPRHAVGRRTARARYERTGRAGGRNRAPAGCRPGDRGRAQAQHQARRPARRHRHAAIRDRRPGDERRRRLRHAQGRDRQSPREEPDPYQNSEAKKIAVAPAITAVAAQPRTAPRRASVKCPIARGLVTISIISAISGAASTPLMTALQ